MATITLNEILSLVGKLDDSTGTDPARESFRSKLHKISAK
jgi:hypothetical protein